MSKPAVRYGPLPPPRRHVLRRLRLWRGRRRLRRWLGDRHGPTGWRAWSDPDAPPSVRRLTTTMCKVDEPTSRANQWSEDGISAQWSRR